MYHLNLVLSVDSKGAALKFLKPLLSSNGVVFGSTIMGSKCSAHTSFGKALLRRFNAPFDKELLMSGIFANDMDTLEDLHKSLRAAFTHYEVKVEGVTIFFAATDDPARLE